MVFEVVVLAVLIGAALGFEVDFAPEVVEAEQVGERVELVVGKVVDSIADDKILELRKTGERPFEPTFSIVERSVMFVNGYNAFYAGM